MVIIDLDGTLVRGNTFRMFMRYLLRKTWLRNQKIAAFKLASFSVLRLGRLITHRRLKWAVMRVADNVLTEGDFDAFASMLPQQFNLQVRDLIQPQKTVIATAAPSEYVAPLAKLLGVEYIATERPQSGKYSDFSECRGTEKLRRVKQKWGRDNDVVTDHADDLALLAASTGRRVLVKPSASTLTTVRLAGISVEVWS